MSRIHEIDPAEATGKVKHLLDGVQARFGRTPNLIKTMAQSPTTLEAYLNLRETLDAGPFGAKFDQQLALAISQANSSEYLLAVHTLIAKQAIGLDDVEIGLNRQAKSADMKTAAGLAFARRILETRGAVTDEELAEVRAAG